MCLYVYIKHKYVKKLRICMDIGIPRWEWANGKRVNLPTPISSLPSPHSHLPPPSPHSLIPSTISPPPSA